MSSIVFEEKNDNLQSVVMRCPFYLHCTIEKNKRELQNEFGSSLKIFVRNSPYDTFSYEHIFHLLTKNFNCENAEFNVFLFDYISDVDIISSLIELFNQLYSTKFSLELNEREFTVKSSDEILLQSSL
jgi:hypothetical protein